MLGKRLENGLANPPNRIGNEFVALRPIEAVSRRNQPEIAGTDQVGGETDRDFGIS